MMGNAPEHGANVVRDVLLHEMIHARLILDGRDPGHNSPGWSEWITKLSPTILGQEIQAEPIVPRRIDGKVQRVVRDGFLPRKDMARWPQSLRPADWDRGQPIAAPSY